MPSLRELQLDFAAALFEGDEKRILPHIELNGLSSAARMAVYRNNARANFTRSLALEFPVIERLVGEDYFLRLAGEFMTAHPSRAGDLQHIGAPFPAYLRSRFGGTEYAYFADVAELECAWQESLIAADAASFDFASLARIASEDYGQLRFALHPACRLVRSPCPILRVWSANQPGSSDTATIDLGVGGDAVLVHRAKDGVELRRLTEGEFALLESLAAGGTLSQALERADKTDKSFDLTAALAVFVRLGVFSGAVCVPEPLKLDGLATMLDSGR